VNQVEDFSAFVAARWPRLVRSAMLLGCSRAGAEDLVQTTLERCLLNWRKAQHADDPTRTCIGSSSARSRRHVGGAGQGRIRQPSPPEHLGSDETGRVDPTDAVLRALQRLLHDQRAAVVLRYYAHLTEQQMASVFGVATGTVKSRLSRALNALADDPSMAELRGTLASRRLWVWADRVRDGDHVRSVGFVVSEDDDEDTMIDHLDAALGAVAAGAWLGYDPGDPAHSSNVSMSIGNHRISP
jgi:DNA-directed RNA polymerase specialized sigma24 family protein